MLKCDHLSIESGESSDVKIQYPRGMFLHNGESQPSVILKSLYAGLTCLQYFVLQDI